MNTGEQIIVIFMYSAETVEARNRPKIIDNEALKNVHTLI